MKNKKLKKYCLYCDGEYTALRADSKFCSHSCRQMAYKSKVNGGVGWRISVNSMPRSERELLVNGQNPQPAVSQVSTVTTKSRPNHQSSVNLSSNTEGITPTNRQPVVNVALEHLKLELEKMRYKAELAKKTNDEIRELEKQELKKQLQNILTWAEKKKIHLSELKFTTKAISEILIKQRDIFKDSYDQYRFLTTELIPKLKGFIRQMKRERSRICEFQITNGMFDKLKLLNNCLVDSTNKHLSNNNNTI